MKLAIFLVASIALCVAQTYEPTWESLDKRPLPAWYNGAKFGIFMHWGVYSVPSWAPVGQYAEWYWYWLSVGFGPTYEFHVQNYGENFNYQDFAPMFKAELFNATQWADIFSQSGAKYIVLTCKHHEGYTLWPSAQSWNWNSVDVGPQRDIVQELFAAVKERDIHPGLYYSLYEWFNPLYRGKQPHEYVEQVMLPQLYDIATNYQPDIIWSDGAWDYPSSWWNSTEFIAWLYNESPNKNNVVINDRWGNDTPGVHGGFYTAEYSSSVYLTHKWEENSGVDIHSYGYNRNSLAEDYLTAEYLIHLLVRTVAFGGNLLLDFGPAHDGSIPVVAQERLLSIGAWLQVNGESIYDTTLWTYQNESDVNVFYTQNTNLKSVYAIFTQWPETDFTLKFPQPTPATVITFLGYDGVLKYTDGVDGLSIQLPVFTPNTIPCDYAWVLKMTNVNSN